MFMDDDGTAYQVRTSFTVVQLTDDYLGPAKLSSEIKPPHGSEPPGAPCDAPHCTPPSRARKQIGTDCAHSKSVWRACVACVCGARDMDHLLLYL